MNKLSAEELAIWENRLNCAIEEGTRAEDTDHIIWQDHGGPAVDDLICSAVVFGNAAGMSTQDALLWLAITAIERLEAEGQDD